MALTPAEQQELDSLELEQLQAEKHAATRAAPAPKAPDVTTTPATTSGVSFTPTTTGGAITQPTSSLPPAYSLESTSTPDNNVVQEQHPDIGFGTRALVKNLSQSDAVTRKYLEGKGFQTDVVDGQIVVRKPGEARFRVIDPKGFDPQDITDLAYDIPSGIAQGVATAAGGIAAGVPTGGVGAIPGAMAASGATAAASEALRQKLGQWAGLPQEVSGRDVATMGIVGAATPLAFGAGATAGQVAKQGLSEEAAQQLSKNLASPVMRGVKAAVPAMAAASSGVPSDVVKTYAARMPEADTLMEPGNFDSYINNVHKEVNAPREQLHSEITDATANYIEQQKNAFRQNQAAQVEQAKQTLGQKLEALKARAAQEEADRMTALQSRHESMRSLQRPMEDPEVLQKKLQDSLIARKKELGDKMSKNLENADTLIPKVEIARPMLEKIMEMRQSEVAQTPNGKAAIDELIAQVKNTFEGLPENVSAKTAFQLQDQFKLSGNLQSVKGGFQNRFGANADVLAKQWSDANAAAYRNTNKLLDKVAQTQGLKDEFRKVYTAQESFDKYMGTPEKTLQTIHALDKPKNMFAKKTALRAKELTNGEVDLIAENNKLRGNENIDKSFVKINAEAEKSAKNSDKNYWADMAQAQREHDQYVNEAARAADKNDSEALRLSDRLLSSQPNKPDPKLAALYENAGVADKVAQLNEYNATLGNQFDTPEKVARTLVSHSKKVVNPNFEQRMSRIDQQAGTNLMSDAELLRTYAYFKDPSLVQLSGGGSTGTSRTLTGAGLGTVAGGLLGGPLGAKIGAAGGAIVSSPLGVKYGVKAMNLLPSVRIPQQLKPLPARAAPWLNMKTGREK